MFRRPEILWAGILGAAALLSCEHDQAWRGAEPYSDAEIAAFADPMSDANVALRTTAYIKPGADADRDAYILSQSAGCISCHGPTDEPDMHANSVQPIGCVDCHGGDPTVHSTLDAPGRPGQHGNPIADQAYVTAMQKAHVQPRNRQAWYGADLLEGRDFGKHAHTDDSPFGSANPKASAALLNLESPEFIRFVNPADLRVADLSCGACHGAGQGGNIVERVRHSMMAHGAQLWGAALYNNGAFPLKVPHFGESYSAFGLPQLLQGVVENEFDDAGRPIARMPTDAERLRGVIDRLFPLPVWNITQPGNMLRIFERGTRLPVPGTASPAEIGNPNVLAEGGRPDKGLSPRGLGTLNRTDPVFLGLQKTRLLDPILSFLGTNDHPGDFRSSGCSACHVLYANDRDPSHSGPIAESGSSGASGSLDAVIPRNVPGHPIKHVFTNAIPSSQCIVCHIHPGTSYANTYLGYMWWDNESDGEFMYPSSSQHPSADQEWRSFRVNPEAASKKGLWGDLYPTAESHASEVAGEGFLARTGEPGGAFNSQLKHNQFADFHGHGWMFRAVHKKDRRGNLLDREGAVIDPHDPDRLRKAVHLKDVHLEKGMHCIDCHFEQDSHGTGHLFGEVRNAIEVTCIDCHGTTTAYATLRASGPAAGIAAKNGTGRDFSKDRVGKFKRFEWDEDGNLIQRSAVDPSRKWTVPQTIDTINPESAWSKANPEAARKSRYAKTVKRDASGGLMWGSPAAAGDSCPDAHALNTMECYTCHTSWMTSCSGCHLPMKANQRTPMLHNESAYSRNYTQYNFQVLRDDIFQLGRDTTVKGGRIVPIRSSTAVMVSSQNANREWIYHQQQTVSSEGFNGQAFNPHFPHATGGRGTTKQCTDCHLSDQDDNNAWMAQLFLQGTNFVNFLGRYVYVAQGSAGLEAVAVTEHDEPQAVYGSHLHHLAYPDEFAAMPRVGGASDLSAPVLLNESYHHGGKDALLSVQESRILDLQQRGEYLYAARGPAGFQVFDIANIDNKGFSERIVTAPVSPLGQRLGFDTANCVAVASPSTLAVDPARTRMSNDQSKPRAIGMDEAKPWHVNQEGRIHPLYAYLYIGDAIEGLVLTSAATLLDGDPTNNFLHRATLADGTTAFNPEGKLTGLAPGGLAVAGKHLYAAGETGLSIIDIDDPLTPRILSHIGSDQIDALRGVAVQFRYAFVTDRMGLRVVDITDPAHPVVRPLATIPLDGAERLYVARTWCLVATRAGLAVIDVTNPESPRLQEVYNADGLLSGARDVKAGMTNASLFAYVACGDHGHGALGVVNLMGPDTTPNFRGFSPPLQPKLIAYRQLHGEGLALSKGLDRDRASDESGNQIAVFGRLGSRPLSVADMSKMFLHNGVPWKVGNDPSTDPVDTGFEFPEPPFEE